MKVRVDLVDIDERDAFGELGVVRIAGQQRAGLRVHFGLQVQQAFGSQIPQHPFPIARDGQTARPAGEVAQFQDRELHRRVQGHIHGQLGGDAVLGVLEHGIAKPVADDIRRRAARGQRRRRPELSGLLIPDVEGLARWRP